jgi:hypothetical protein
MGLDLNTMAFVMMIFGASTFILIMFLPALLELKKPKDAGPRRIMEEVVVYQHSERIDSMEVEFDRNIVRKVSEIISVLPNLEG